MTPLDATEMEAVTPTPPASPSDRCAECGHDPGYNGWNDAPPSEGSDGYGECLEFVDESVSADGDESIIRCVCDDPIHLLPAPSEKQGVECL